MVDYNYYSGGYGSGDYSYGSSSSSSSSNKSTIGSSGYTSVDAIAKQSSSGLGAKTSSKLDQKGYTPTKSKSTASGKAYQATYNDDYDSPTSVVQASSVATQQAGGSPHVQTKTADPMNWYNSDIFNVPSTPVTAYTPPSASEIESYVYTASKEMEKEQIDNLLAEAMGYSTPAAGLTIVEDRPLTAEERQKFKPLLDMAKDRIVPSITTTELPSMQEMQQKEDEAIKEAIKQIQNGVPLDQVLTNITDIAYRGEDETPEETSVGDSFVGGEYDTADIKPLTKEGILAKLGGTSNVGAAQASDLGMIGGVKKGNEVWQNLDSNGMAHNSAYKDYSQQFREYTTTKKPGYIEVGTQNGKKVYAAPDNLKDKNGNYITVSKDDAFALAKQMGSIIPTRDMVKNLYKQAARIPMVTMDNSKGGDVVKYTQELNKRKAAAGLKDGVPIVHSKEFFSTKPTTSGEIDISPSAEAAEVRETTGQGIMSKPSQPSAVEPGTILLDKGSSKKLDVTELQKALNSTGAKLTVDGDYGPATEKAIKAFQKKSGLTETGKFDSATYNAMIDGSLIIPQEAGENPNRVTSKKPTVNKLNTPSFNFKETTGSGSVSGVGNEYEVNGKKRSIIDVSQSTEQLPQWTARPNRPTIQTENIVLHWTEANYTNGVKHFMNSFNSHNNVTAAFFVDKKGQIYKVFDPTKKGAHVAGSTSRNPHGIITNSNSIGIEVEGTTASPPSKAAKEATAWLTDYLVGEYDVKNVYAHPQANNHKGDKEGYDLLNHWRESHGMSKISESKLYSGTNGAAFKAAQ